MRADRLLSILLLLQTHRRMTAGQLAKRLEVSERTILRDMEALGTAGVPVVAERGVRGGWSLLAGYRANLTGLNEPEVRAIFAAPPARLLADLQLGAASDRAIIKLLAALDPMNRRTGELARQRLHIDTGGWNASREPVPHLLTMYDAVWQQRRVRVQYGEEDDRERLLAPLGLVAKGATWYVVAVSADVVRTYRISRIRSAVILDETFARPADFDLSKYWEESGDRFRAALPRYDVVALVRSESVRWLESMMRFGRIDRIDDGREGWKRIDMHFDAEEVARAVLLGMGDAVEVIEPAALRRTVAAAAQAAADVYSASSLGQFASALDA